MFYLASTINADNLSIHRSVKASLEWAQGLGSSHCFLFGLYKPHNLVYAKELKNGKWENTKEKAPEITPDLVKACRTRNGIHERLRPSADYLCPWEFAKLHGVTSNVVYNWLYQCKIESTVLHYHYRFIHKDTPVPIYPRRKRRSKVNL